MKRIALLLAVLAPAGQLMAGCGCGGKSKQPKKSEPVKVEKKAEVKKVGNQPLDTKKFFYDLEKVTNDVVQQVPMPKQDKVLAFEYTPSTGMFADKEMHIAVIGGKEDGGNRYYSIYRKVADEQEWTYVKDVYFAKLTESVKAKVGRDGFLSMDNMRVAVQTVLKRAKKDALKKYDIPCCGNCSQGKPCKGDSKK